MAFCSVEKSVINLFSHALPVFVFHCFFFVSCACFVHWGLWVRVMVNGDTDCARSQRQYIVDVQGERQMRGMFCRLNDWMQVTRFCFTPESKDDKIKHWHQYKRKSTKKKSHIKVGFVYFWNTNMLFLKISLNNSRTFLCHREREKKNNTVKLRHVFSFLHTFSIFP